MKKNIFIWTIAMLFVACGPDARLDMVGMFAGSSPKIDDGFTESQRYNNLHGFCTLQAPNENYHVYVCTDTHITKTQKRWTNFIENYRQDILCPVAVHLGDIIDAQNHYDEMYSAYLSVPMNPAKSDTLMAIAGNHDIYFKDGHNSSNYLKLVRIILSFARHLVQKTCLSAMILQMVL